MIPKDNRLRTKADFDYVFKKGKIYHSKGISAKVAKNKLGITRLGFIISTKVHKKAVKRNKVRRRLRTIFGRHLQDLKSGLDVVILTRKDVLEMSFDDLKESAEHLIKKAELKK